MDKPTAVVIEDNSAHTTIAVIYSNGRSGVVSINKDDCSASFVMRPAEESAHG
jgi:hypothetical protein